MAYTGQMSESDEALMQSYQAGDLLAFEALYLRSSPKLYGYLKKKLNSQNEVDDVFQQVFLKLHRSRNAYDPQYRFEQWLFVIARTTVLDHFRKLKRSDVLLYDEDISNIPHPQEVESASSDGSDSREIPDLSVLTSEQQSVIQWRVFDEASYEEISKRLNRSEATVRQVFSRAVRKLKSIQSKNLRKEQGHEKLKGKV